MTNELLALLHESKRREQELQEMVLRLAERIFLAHEVLANLAEKRKGVVARPHNANETIQEFADRDTLFERPGKCV